MATKRKRANAPTTNTMWPRATDVQRANGWKLDADFLRDVKAQADRDAAATDGSDDRDPPTVDLEEIEAVLLAVEKVRRA